MDKEKVQCNLEVGDKIAVYYARDLKQVLTVTRVTKTLAIVSAAYRFKRSYNPSGLGLRRHQNETNRRFDITHYKKATDEDILLDQSNKLKEEITRKLEQKELTLEQLKQIAEIIK